MEWGSNKLNDKVAIAAPCLDNKELEYISDCIKSGWISSKGKYVTTFEQKFAEFLGVKHGIAVSNGTVALHLALATLGVGTGDEVILPTLTMISCVNAISYTGAKPVLVDSDPRTLNIDSTKVARKITKKTKAIMPVHLYGHPVDMDPILEVARANNLYVVEDAAEAHGAEYKGKKVGAIGDIGCFSFYANKIITTGEGGMITTNNDELAMHARKLCDQAYNAEMRKWLIHDEVGFNYRLTNMQAAVGLAQLEKINLFIGIHRKNAELYNSLLEEVEGITLPPEESWAKNVYWMYTILVDNTRFGISRDKLMLALESCGIDSRSVFYPIHMQPAYKKLFVGETYPVAENIHRKGVNLPSGNTTTQQEVRQVAEAIVSFKEKGN